MTIEDSNYQYKEDTLHATKVRGPAVIAIREDIDINFANDHEYAPLQLNNQGRLKVDSARTTQSLSEWFEDTPHTTGDTGVFVLAVRNDGDAVLTSTDMDYSPIAVTNTGKLKVDTTATQKRTYSACSIVTPAASATDIFTITGAPALNVKIQSIHITGEREVASNTRIRLIKRSTANTGGTSSVVTGVPFSSADAAASAVVREYSVNPTLGTTVGTIREGVFAITPVINTQGNQGATFIFDEGRGKEVSLISVSEVLAVNLVGVSIAGGLLYVNIQWTEESL